MDVADFKFGIGDAVQHKGGGQHMVVVARCREEGPAGVEKMYWATWFNRSGDSIRFNFSECELESAPRPKPETVVDALVWLKNLMVADRDYEAAAMVRDMADKILKRWAEKKQ